MPSCQHGGTSCQDEQLLSQRTPYVFPKDDDDENDDENDDEEEKELLLLLHETSRIFRHSRSRRESLRTVTRGVRELERFV